VVGPAIGKLEGLFGLVGWAGRAPFYVLPLYVGPVVLWARPRLITGLVVGLVLAIPLALWSIAARCLPFVVFTYLASGALQGLVLAWLARPRRE
jgi:flagellar biosynthesis protein FliQ